MRCKTCDYRLWNLAARQCPECGSPFRPSDFEFAVNSVRFACPHCRQTYYGTGERGHLQPVEFDCVRCHQHVHMDQMILLPADGVDETRTTLAINPWLERSRRGAVRSWFATIYRSMVSPQSLIRATPLESSTGTAVWFATLSMMLFTLTGMGLFMMIPLFAIAAGGGNAAGGAIGVLAFFLLAPPIFYLLWLLVWSLSVHLVLKFTGDVDADFRRTLQAMCYSSSANIVSAVPCLGIYLGWIGGIWWIISAVLMIRDGQRVSGARATWAVLALPLTLLVVGIIAGVLTFGYVVQQMPKNMPTPPGPTPAPTVAPTLPAPGMSGNVNVDAYLLSQAINHFATAPGRAPLQHGSQLLAKRSLTNLAADSVIAQPSNTTLDVIRFGGTTLDRFVALDPTRQELAIQQAISDLPDDVVAHRVGDVVFTFHGIDWSKRTAQANVWAAIVSHDPTANALMRAADSTQPIYALHVDGAAQVLQPREFDEALARQNELREHLNLPPLPDPATVTDSKPATQRELAVEKP